jgi:hypothetical protein
MEVRTSLLQQANSYTTKQMSIEVSNVPTLGQDGTLANDLRVQWGYLGQRDSDPTSWYGSIGSAGWADTPGIYYFQFTMNVTDAGYRFDPNPSCPARAQGCVYSSPIYALTIAAQQPAQPVSTTPAVSPPAATTPKAPRALLSARMASQHAKSYAIHHYQARRPTAVCRRVSRAHMVCRVVWRNRKHKRVVRQIEVWKDPGDVYTVQPL